MNKKMIEILACPIDKHFPLEVYEAKSKDQIISEGAIYCSKCARFYPIIEEIPMMLPDELRDKNLDIEFLKRNQIVLPEKITKHASPWHL